MQNNKNKK